jgi:transcriptional regulator GlxA family with amidase domain
LPPRTDGGAGSRLAIAGLLDGCVATTHWAEASLFTARDPRVLLRAAEIVAEQNRILCSGKRPV